MPDTLDDLFAAYPALHRHLVPALRRTKRAERHPLVTRLREDKVVPHFMRVLDNLLGSAESADWFDDLVSKLAEAPLPARFLDAVTELTVVSRLVRLGATDVALIPTGDSRSPDVS